MKLLRILSLLLLTVLLSSCRGTKRIITGPVGSGTEQARFEQVIRNNFAFDALQSKSRYTLGGTSLGGKLCMESGRRLCLQVNAPMLGFEVARVEASQQQVVVVDKYDKMYCVENPAELYQLDGISGHEMAAIESLILGRIFLPGVGLATSRDFDRLTWATPTLPNGTQGNTLGTYATSGYTLQYEIDANGRLASTTLRTGSRVIRLDYQQYGEVAKDRWVPVQETVTVTSGQGRPMTIGIALSSPELGESSWRDFEPNATYRKVKATDLVDTVKALIH